MKKENLLCISKLNGKLSQFNAISTYTLENNFCIKMHKAKKENVICTYCYSHDSLNKFRFPSLNNALKRNSNILSNRLLTSEEIKENYIFNSHSFRFNAHGELINELHLKNLINICLHNPNTNFGLWSKRKDLIKKYFRLNDKPTFNNVNYDIDIEKQNCTGQKCIDCLKCYKHDTTKTIIEAIKLNGRVKKDLPKITVIRKAL
jgi:hypothetical protein